MAPPRGPDASFSLSSTFRVDWLAELPTNEREEIERAVALVAANVLRSARFARLLAERAGVDAEVRVWIESALDPLQILVWWEPRMDAFWFPVVDPSDGARLGLVVFDRVPSVDAARLVRDEADFAGAVSARLLRGPADAAEVRRAAGRSGGPR